MKTEISVQIKGLEPSLLLWGLCDAISDFLGERGFEETGSGFAFLTGARDMQFEGEVPPDGSKKEHREYHKKRLATLQKRHEEERI